MSQKASKYPYFSTALGAVNDPKEAPDRITFEGDNSDDDEEEEE